MKKNNKMKLVLSLLIFTLTLFSQDAAISIKDSDAAGSREAIDNSTANANLTWFDIDLFEDAGVWQGDIPGDQGIIRITRREGAPAELKKDTSQPHKYVLGVKVSFFRTSPAWFTVRPPRPVIIPGVTKKLSIWVVGRNLKYQLKTVIRDFSANLHVLEFGPLSHVGWKKMESQVPPNVVQNDYRVVSGNARSGIEFRSLFVDCVHEAYGNYYIYFDDLKAHTDVFTEEYYNRNSDGMKDNW